MNKYYLMGNTLRIIARFRDFDNKLTDPQLVKFILYDHRYNKIEEHVLSDANRIEKGIYFYDYVINNDNKSRTYYYEFYGEIGGKPSLNRGSFRARFI